jgi:hypothetical protein
MKTKRIILETLLAFVYLISVFEIHADGQYLFSENLLKSFIYRNLGPCRVGARISDIAVPEFPVKSHLYTFAF